MEFGRYLKEARIKSGLSMRELSRRSGISHAYISQLESGKKDTPTPEVLLSLSQYIDIEYMELMKIAGYVIDDEDFTDEEVEFLKQLDEGIPLLELLKLRPTLDKKEITPTELELAIDVIRTLRKTKEKA